MRHDVWTVNDDAVAFTLDQTRTDSFGRDSIVYKSRLARDSAGAELDISASLDSRKQSQRLKVGDAFAAAPVSDLAIREVAERGFGHEALICMVDSPPFSAALTHCSVERGPAGERRVRAQSDFDPSRYLYAFDDDGEPLRIALDEAVAIRRVKRADVARGLDWFGKPGAEPSTDPTSDMENEE